MPKYSFVIPVYNRPQEIDELLDTLCKQSSKDFEVIVVDDGSSVPSSKIVEKYESELAIRYYKKENSGPGMTRNYGADLANGEFLIFLDSDCLVPEKYLAEVDKMAGSSDFDAYGGPDRALPSFSNLQKAINYSMTSFITTGGIRGGRKQLENYKPRSFNMGVKKSVFEDLKGFREMRFGEDIDFSIRLERNGYKAILVEEAFVYHRRRSGIGQFYKQVFNSGMARILLGQLHPGSTKLVHTLPMQFVLYSIVSILITFANPWLLLPIIMLISVVFIHSSIVNKSLLIGFLSVITSITQLAGYGLGFIWGTIQTRLFRQQLTFSFLKKYYD